MRAAVFHGVEEGLRLEDDVPAPSIKNPRDVLIKIYRCGMCGTDLGTLEGRVVVRPPLILGHEIAGEVTELGSEIRSLKSGDRVTIDPNISCGVCYYCRSNRPNLCPSIYALGEQIDGGYADYVVAPESAVFKVPDSMPWDTIPLAEPLSDVVNGLAKTGIRPGESAVVYGAGTMGLLWLSILKRSGSGTLISVEPRERRAEAALKVGADFVIDPTKRDPVAEVRGLTEGRGADVAVEAIGRSDTVELSIKSSARGGRVVLMGVCKPDAMAGFSPYEIMSSERKIMGTFIANGSVPLAIEELAKGFIRSEVFVTHKLPLQEILRAVDLNRKGESVKTLIIPDGT